MPVKFQEAFDDLGDLNFQDDSGRLWIHRYGQRHDDLMVEYNEIPDLIKKLKKIYKWEEKSKKKEKKLKKL